MTKPSAKVLLDSKGRPADPVEEQWVYAGCRWDTAKKKLYHLWEDPTHDQLGYDKVSGAVIGGKYSLMVQRVDKRVFVTGNPRYLGDAEHPALAAWEGLHIAAKAIAVTVRWERSDARVSALTDALKPLEDIARTCRTGSERDALIAFVIRKLNAVW